MLASCDQVELAFGDVLIEPGNRIRHVYFPINSFISLLTFVDGGPALEVGLVGNEGVQGSTLALGIDESPLRALVQGAGPALRMTKAAFQRERMRCPALQKTINRYLYVAMRQLAISAACTRFHVVEARLARWLLMTQDRAHDDRFAITHVFLATMLGVRRAGVSNAANALQSRGLITYKRGQLTVVNRRGLEKTSCSCYRAQIAVYDHIL